MLERSDYLLPIAAGQRQFRQDNYNMASAALLEDLFFDALGMFVRENHPQVALERRTGKELWDYGVNGLPAQSQGEPEYDDLGVVDRRGSRR